MKNKIILILSLLLLSALASYSTYSFFSYQTVDIETENKLGEWRAAEAKIKIFKDNLEYSDEELIDQEKSTETNHSFLITSNQYLSFEYKLESSEIAEGFDNPSFIVLINEQVVLQRDSVIGEWKREFIDLSEYIDQEVIIEIKANNTVDQEYLPVLEVRDVSSASYLAKRDDKIKFSLSKDNATLFIEYKTNDDGVISDHILELSDSLEFVIDEHIYEDEIEYYSLDSFGNREDSKYLNIYTDFTVPEPIDDITLYIEGEGEISLTFTSPNETFTDSVENYDIRKSTNIEELQLNWLETEKLTLNNHKKFGYASLPQSSGLIENMLLTGIPEGRLFIGVKSNDQAGNYSLISEVIEVN